MNIRRLGEPGDLGWVVRAHGELYAQEFGWDSTFEALVARIVADFATSQVPQREAAWIAEDDDGRVGCVFCVMYLAAGFELVAEQPHHSYGVALVGQTYARDL